MSLRHASHLARGLTAAAVAVGLLTLIAPSAQPAGVVVAPASVRAVEWGINEVPDQVFTQVAEGYWGGYGITPAGKVIAWGSDFGGALDIPPALNSKTTVQVAAGYRHGLALTSDGQVTTWGWLDDAKTVPAEVPAELAGVTVTAIAAGGNHDLALTSEGTVIGWGVDDSWSGDDGGLFPLPEALDGQVVTKIATGFYGAAAVTDEGKLITWGEVSAPQDWLSDKTVVAIDLGTFSGLALTSDGTLSGWGGNQTGQLDIPASLDGKTVTAFAVGEQHAVAATSDGTVVGWGNDETAHQEFVPDDLAGKTIVDLQADRYRTIATYAALGTLNAPTVSGEARIGSTLTAGGTAFTATPDSLSYAWAANGVPVGTDSPTYVVGVPDLGRAITVTVTATKAGYAPVTSTSVPTSDIAQGVFSSGPSPKVVGTTRVGRVLTGSVTTTVPTADSLSFQWLRNGVPIDNATKTTYLLTPEDFESAIRVRVTVTRSGYTNLVSTSPASSPIGLSAKAFTVTAPRTAIRGHKVRIRIGSLENAERFTIKLGTKPIAHGTMHLTGYVSLDVKIPANTAIGHRMITVVGAYSDRRGSDSITVLRR